MIELYIENSHLTCIALDDPFQSDTDVVTKIDNLLEGKVTDYYLVNNGRIIRKGDILRSNVVHVVPRLLGGKGGFGSMLRAIGAQIEKTTNREACRDLSGRRLRDINEEKRLKKWIAEQADREREAAEKKKKKLEKLAHEPKHEFSDPHYDQERSQMVDKVYSAVEEGLKVSSTTDEPEPSTSKGVKRKAEPPKKGKGMLWIDGELDSEEEISEEENDNERKKLKVSNP